MTTPLSSSSENERAVIKTSEGEMVAEFWPDVAPKTVERLLKAYLAHRSSPDETFLSFARRHDGETLRKLADAEVSS